MFSAESVPRVISVITADYGAPIMMSAFADDTPKCRAVRSARLLFIRQNGWAGGTRGKWNVATQCDQSETRCETALGLMVWKKMRWAIRTMMMMVMKRIFGLIVWEWLLGEEEED